MKSNSNQVFGIILIAGSLFLLFSDKIISPVPPEISPFVKELRGVMVGADASKDAENLGNCLVAAANLFVEDSKRAEPLYVDNEGLKWAVRNINSLSYPLGWRMEDKYPQLPQVLGKWFEEKLSGDFSKSDFVRELNSVGQALKAV